MPSPSPFNIYTLSSWARSTIVPFSIIFHHRPVFALPNGRSANNNFLDELWCDASSKHYTHLAGWAAALCDAGIFPSNELLQRILQWVKGRQIPDKSIGDWQINNSDLISGSHSFQYTSNWNPDVDDTAVTILKFVEQDPKSVGQRCVAGATQWILGMQNCDGGWGAFDLNNNHLYLNKVPFDDLGGLCDPYTADVPENIVDALGLLIHNEYVEAELRKRLTVAAERGTNFIAAGQEPMGAWYGRWARIISMAHAM
ncbi:hypothetical protein MMC07_005382 [Pseudocyphellaria aurata]|nr:hypothetical protein [Pseudocyphellaria aurata]